MLHENSAFARYITSRTGTISASENELALVLSRLYEVRKLLRVLLVGAKACGVEAALAMARIKLETFLKAPPAACYALASNTQAHLESAHQTQERVIAGPASGQLELGDVVTWEARHLGVRQRLTVRIMAASPPHHFRDELVRGAFRTLRHDHYFDAVPGGTLMRDIFEFSSPVGFIGRWFDKLFLKGYLTRFLRARNAVLKQRLEWDG